MERSYGDLLQLLQGELLKPEASIAVVVVDLFDVAGLQARMGFEASGSLLRRLHEGLGNALHARGHVIRLGDGRYCAVVKAIRNRGHAVLAAEKLARVAEEVFATATVAVTPQYSSGIALYPSHSRDAAELLDMAQLASAAARERMVRTLPFDENCAAQVVKPWELGAAFAQALDAGELSVFYQPKVSLSEGKTVGVEALLRWQRNGETVATPDVFIPLAEGAGLIHGTTWYVLSQACRLSAEHNGLSVAVNVTPGMLHHREFLDMVQAALAAWNARDGILTLEITEGGLIADAAEAMSRLNKLRDIGVRVSIDDFGTGYSSLSYFKKIAADEVKIDKSFIMNMMMDSADRRIVETILALARQFHLNTVAEGVENWSTFDALTDMGCHCAQGFLFSRALCADSLRSWLQENSGDLRLRNRT